MNARNWLTENGYDDVVALIDEVTAEWKGRAIRTRRDWWVILAGDSRGEARVVAGRAFPVLWAAQKRQGRRRTKNALKRRRSEIPPPIIRTRRWQRPE